MMQQNESPTETKETETAQPVKTDVQDQSEILTKAKRNELEALSQSLFGSKSKYKKLYEQQYYVMRKQVNTVTNEDGATKEVESEVPVLFNGRPQLRVRYLNHTGVKELMLSYKAQLDKMIAEQAKAQVEADNAQAPEETLGEVKAESQG